FVDLFVLSGLESPDRFVRYAARIALEHRMVSRTGGFRTYRKDKLFSSKSPDAVTNYVVALTRHVETLLPRRGGGAKGLDSVAIRQAFQQPLLEALSNLDFDKLDERQQLDLLRAY